MSLTCNTCALITKDGYHCSRTSELIKPFEDSCSHHVRTVTLCDICGAPIIRHKYIEVINDKLYVFCATCSNKMFTCSLCDKAQECSFQTDPSPIPQTVVKQFRQGNMIMQGEVANPDRIAITCAQCDCWIDEQCQKENRRCEKFQHTF